MSQQILSGDNSGPRLPAATPPAILVIAILWLAFACGLPLYQLREARRQAHQDMLRVLATDKADTEGVIAAFDRSNRKLDAAAFGPCLLLAFTSILLVNQMFKLKRRFHGPGHDPSVPEGRQRRTG